MARDSIEPSIGGGPSPPPPQPASATSANAIAKASAARSQEASVSDAMTRFEHGEAHIHSMIE